MDFPKEVSARIPVSKPAILRGRLPAVAGVAEGLKVLFIPHKIFIALVRSDVVNVRSGHRAPLLQTLRAKRVF